MLNAFHSPLEEPEKANERKNNFCKTERAHSECEKRMASVVEWVKISIVEFEMM